MWYKRISEGRVNGEDSTMKSAVIASFIGFFVFMVILTFSVNAETLDLLSNTDVCTYQPEINKDYCKTEYELCDFVLNENKINFIFGDFTYNPTLPENEFKTSIKGLETEIKIENYEGCYKVEIEGYKNPLMDIDNVLCYDGNCHYEYALWNGTFQFRNAIFGNVSGLTSLTEGLVPKNISIAQSLELFQCEWFVNSTNRTIGYVYFNNQTDYICVAEDETSAVVTIIDEGNSSEYKVGMDVSIIGFYTLNITGLQVDQSLYKRNLAEAGDPSKTTGKIGNGVDFQTDDKYTGSTFDFDGMSDLSISLWINTDNNAGDPVPISKFDSGQNSWFMQHMNTDKLDFQLNDEGGATLSLGAGMSAVPKNKWVHVVINYNSTCLLVYIDGSLNFTSACQPSDTVKTTTSFLRLGAYHGGLFYDGQLDNVMLFNKTLTPDEVRLLYGSQSDFVDNGSVEINGSEIIITFVNQSPADITSTNLMTQLANITYNISGSDVNISTIELEVVVNSSQGISFINVNGVSTPLNQSHNFTFNESISFTTLLGDNTIYPASYVIDDETMEDTIHSFFTAVNNNNIIKTTIRNVTNSSLFSIYEIMANSSVGSCNIIACNSSYSTGSFTTSPNCAGFATIQQNTPFDHCHNSTEFSCHVFESLGLDIATGTIGDVVVTPDMQFIIQGTGCNVFYIANNTGTAQTSVNNGISWTNQLWSIDSHLHQFPENTILNYRQCDTSPSGEKICSVFRLDNLDVTPLPPSAPSIITPLAGEVSGLVNISYEECISPIGNIINYYNISLFYTNFTEFSFIVNNSLLLSFLWNSSTVTDDDYRVGVICVDNQSLNNSAFSEVINVLNNITIDIPNSAVFCSSDTTLFTREVKVERTLIDGTWVTNVTDEQTFLTCPTTCENETFWNLGQPGCTETDLQWAVIIIIIVLLGGLMVWVVQR